MQIRKYRFAVIGFLLAVLSACSVSMTAGVRSGTVSDDYVEEPLSLMSKKYATALETSNEILAYLDTENFQPVISNHIDGSLKEKLDAKNLEAMVANVKQKMGDIQAYKTMQWGFVPKQVNGTDLLYSFKIVEHENGRLNYVFVFRNDEKYQELAGLHFRKIDGVRAPNVI